MATANVETALVAKLKATAAVTAVVGSRIYPQLDTQEGSSPQIVYKKLGAEPTNKLAGSGQLKAYTLQLDCYAETETAAAALGKLVRDALTPSAGAWRDTTVGVDGAFHLDSNADNDPNSGFRYHSETFLIWFKPV